MDSILIALQNSIVDWNSNIKGIFGWKDVFEVLIIVSILLLLYQKFIKDSQSEKFVKGIFILIFVWVLSEILVRLNLKI